MTSPRAPLLCLLAFVSFFMPGEAFADFSLGVSARVETSPYKGCSTQWTPFPVVSYEGDSLYIRGTNVGFKAVNLDFFEFSAFAAYDAMSFRRHESSDRQLKLLDNRDSSIVGGLGARLTTPVGMFHLAASVDLMDNSNGFTGVAGYIYSFDFGIVELLPVAGVYWNNAQYNTYYYGVSGRESQRSGLAGYTAEQSFSPYFGLTVDVALGDNWEVFLQGEVTLLGRPIKRSPMVGSSQTKALSTGVMFTF